MYDKWKQWISIVSFNIHNGGADHSTTFLYTQYTHLALFLIGNLDVLKIGRCTPNQSYINPAERSMSLLNIGLYGLALQRGHAGAFEKIISSCKTMKGLKEKSNEHQWLKGTYLASLEKSRKISVSWIERKQHESF